MTSVWEGYRGLVDQLRAQGFEIESAKDLKPVWIGHSGYVGCELQRGGAKERIWIADPLARPGAEIVSSTAEWLTLKLRDGRRAIPDLVHEFIHGGGFDCVDGQLSQVERYGFSLDYLFGLPIARATLLAKVADRMGFVIDPLAQTMELPEDHPLRSQR